MHDPGAEPLPLNARLDSGVEVTGVVVCHHHFGIGVKLDGRDEYAHVDIISIDPGGPPLDETLFPPVGSTVTGTVLGYTPDDGKPPGQLRLRLRPSQSVG
jgi:hypothetical protein